MSNVIILSIITLLVLFYIYLKKYYKDDIDFFFKIMNECLYNFGDRVDLNYDDKDDDKYDNNKEYDDKSIDYDYSMWKKID